MFVAVWWGHNGKHSLLQYTPYNSCDLFLSSFWKSVLYHDENVHILNSDLTATLKNGPKCKNCAPTHPTVYSAVSEAGKSALSGCFSSTRAIN